MELNDGKRSIISERCSGQMHKRISEYVSKWEKCGYGNGIPDEAPIRLEQLGKVPSYRQICMAILKNDNALKSLGFIAKRPEIYHELKRIELKVTKLQLELF